MSRYEKVLERRFYSFTPETILESLAQGNVNVFTPRATSDAMSPISKTMVKWSQEDFFRVAQAIHEKSWGEPLGAQNLFYLSFKMDCSDIERGTFSEAFFQSYSLIRTGEEEKRIEHWITIRPANKLIGTEELEYQPNLHIMKPIDLAQYQINADEGLQIAESTGGYQARMKVDNDCEISAFSPSISGGGWEITYVNYPERFVNTLFRIAIDPQTGLNNVLYPKPE